LSGLKFSEIDVAHCAHPSSAQSAITDVPRRNGLAKRPERGQVAECCHTSGLASSLKNHRCVQRFCAKTSEISK
jgi:hypothetical protein